MTSHPPVVTTHPPFTVQAELDGYLEDLRNPALIPVLGQAGARLAEVARLLGAPPSAGCQDQVGEVAVIVPPGSAAAPVGAALADRVGGRLVAGLPGDLSAGTAVARNVVLLGLADELTLDMVLDALAAADGLRRDGRGEAALGVVLGRNLDEISWLIAKGLGCQLRTPPEHAQLCVAPWGKTDEHDAGESPGTRWVTGPDVRAEVLMPLLSRRYGLVSFATAGREHALILSDTVVCGAGTGTGGDAGAADHRRAADDGRTAAGAGSPCCAFSGQCFREGVTAADVIRAGEIQADVVYANSCMSWRPGHGLVAGEYQLANAFQDGTVAAFIGAVHQMVPDVRLNRLVHAAAAAGASAGQLGIILNREAAGQELPYYVLLGLPWVRPALTAGPVPLDRLAPSPGQTRAAETSAAGDEAVRSCLRQAGRVIQALRDLPLAGLLPSSDLAALDEQVSAVVAGLKGGPAAVRADPEARSAERLLDALAEAELGVALDLHDFWQVSESALSEIWEGFLETSAAPGAGRCPYCAGPTATVTGRHPAYPRLSREVVVCHACGPLLDLPGGSLVETITIDCPPVWPRPGAVEVEVTITPASDVVAAATIQVARAAARGLRAPEPRRLRLRAGQPARLQAEIEVEEHAFAHHEHFVRAIVVADGQVHAASRPVAVRPRP